ncbi:MULTISPECIES: hypothetical protein [Stenotrophomonas]|uniref:hypothetical protein n=1 Tax=Stenotrophomonas TaxID=40323 RepID=UPI0018D41BA3|nr:hypothetical protein [Stenotrophomonas sp.]MBH1507850.1 hypothetical protein [Stenotrophomonas maltophilia]
MKTGLLALAALLAFPVAMAFQCAGRVAPGIERSHQLWTLGNDVLPAHSRVMQMG